MTIEYDMPIDDCYAVGEIERDGNGILVNDLVIYLDVFGKAVRIELPPNILDHIRDKIMQRVDGTVWSDI